MKVQSLPSLKRLTDRVRDDLYSGGKDIVLIFAHNSVGKTRLSMAFKDVAKRRPNGRADTLYFNAFTEDLFSWDNDLDEDVHRYLQINKQSTFLNDFPSVEMDTRIRVFLQRYADFEFRIDPASYRVTFSRKERGRRWDAASGAMVETARTLDEIKISRGEENLFIWCFFLAVVQLSIDTSISAYKWVKYVYIDDPVSSLDDNNAIAVAHDLTAIMRRGLDTPSAVKFIVSSHHSLFFNVVCNELRDKKAKRYYIGRPNKGVSYDLHSTNDQPFFHHIAMLAELKQAAADGTLKTYHFNEMRGILERTARFFGYNHFSRCLDKFDDATLYERALQLLSHRTYSLFDATEMVEDNKDLFRRILAAYLSKYEFELPTT